MLGRTIVVTGAGRGIGAATAKLAASRGYRVCVNYLADKAAADNVVADIAESGGAGDCRCRGRCGRVPGQRDARYCREQPRFNQRPR